MSARGPVHAHPLQGVALILLAAACFASLDSTARGLSQPDGRWGVPVLLIMTLRYTVQAVVMAVALAPRGRAGFASAHPRFQWLRGGLLPDRLALPARLTPVWSRWSAAELRAVPLAS